MTLKEFIEALKEQGVEENDRIAIKSWSNEYEVFVDNGFDRFTVEIER